MAITLADFTKIWASTSPLTPYSFSESNYKEGWNFIGSTPPSRQMWDSIQNQNDERLKYIVDNFLPLAGGTMTGAIAFDSQGEIGFRDTTHTEPAEVCKQIVVTAGTVDSAWDDGNAKICLHTYDSTGTNTAEDGGFALQTSDGNGNSPFLEGKPNGSLKWAGVSLTDGTLLTTRTVSTPTISSSTPNGITVTPPTVSGYQFVCWASSSSEGNVFATYISQTTNKAWWVGSTPTGAHIDCTALYVRKW